MESKKDKHIENAVSKYQKEYEYAPLYYFPNRQREFFRTRLQAALGKSFIIAMVNGAMYGPVMEVGDDRWNERRAVKAIKGMIALYDSSFKQDRNHHLEIFLAKLIDALRDLKFNPHQIAYVLRALTIGEIRKEIKTDLKFVTRAME